MVEAEGRGAGALTLCQCGSEICAPGHRYGPAVRAFMLLHVVKAGRGWFESARGRFTVRAGQGFCIFPDEVTVYGADEDDPWTYAWAGYAGDGAAELTRRAGLSQASPVFEAGQEAFAIVERMARESAAWRLGPLAALGGLYRLLALIGQLNPGAEGGASGGPYEKARWFMEGNYDRPVKVTDVAAFVGLSRSQLYRVFEREAGRSPKEALDTVRMLRARTLLEGTDLALEEIASSVGVSSAERLSLLFRRQFGVPAGKYRHSIRKDRSKA